MPSPTFLRPLQALQFTQCTPMALEQTQKKWAQNDHYYGLGLAYQLANYRNTLFFEAADNKGGKKETAYNINLGLGYDLGSITPQFAYQYAWQDTQYKQHVFGLYAAALVAGGVVKAGVKYLLGKRDKRFQRCNRRR